MTHSGPMAESDGGLHPPQPCREGAACPKCKQINCVTYQEWDSSCGGYTDYKYTCGACGYIWWVDGIDS